MKVTNQSNRLSCIPIRQHNLSLVKVVSELKKEFQICQQLPVLYRFRNYDPKHRTHSSRIGKNAKVQIRNCISLNSVLKLSNQYQFLASSYFHQNNRILLQLSITMCKFAITIGKQEHRCSGIVEVPKLITRTNQARAQIHSSLISEVSNPQVSTYTKPQTTV